MAYDVWIFIFFVAMTILATWKLFNRQRKADRLWMENITKEINYLKARTVPVAAAFQALITTKMTHAHTPELDALLVKAEPPSKLTPEEQKRMTELLIERYKNMDDREVDDLERKAAFIFPFVVDIAKEEYDKIQSNRNE